MNQPDSKPLFIKKIFPYRFRVAELAVGLTINKLMDWPFNYILYPYVIYTCGILQGGIIMMFISLLSCMLTIRFYDWSQRDWMGIEAIKDIKHYQGEIKAGRLVGWFLKRSEPVAFLFLTIWYDPFITMAYLRKGKFNGMTRRDWRIFFISLLIGNGYWIIACYLGITLVELVWRGVKGFVL
jgi:hypothetical protein